MLLCVHQKRISRKKGNRLLVSVTVMGSTGPIRFVMCEEDLVATVIDTALKSYALAGRLPVLGSNFNDFYLYCSISGSEAISPWDTIGSVGARNFMLCKKPNVQKNKDESRRWIHAIKAAKKNPSRRWKSWINGANSLKQSSQS